MKVYSNNTKRIVPNFIVFDKNYRGNEKKTIYYKKKLSLGRSNTGKRNKLKQNIFTITCLFYFEESNKCR